MENKKTFKIEGVFDKSTSTKNVLIVNGIKLRKNRRSNGLTWGYMGPGSISSSMAILYQCVPKYNRYTRQFEQLAQKFTEEKIRPLGQESNFVMDIDLHTWLRENGYTGRLL